MLPAQPTEHAAVFVPHGSHIDGRYTGYVLLNQCTMESGVVVGYVGKTRLAVVSRAKCTMPWLPEHSVALRASAPAWSIYAEGIAGSTVLRVMDRFCAARYGAAAAPVSLGGDGGGARVDSVFLGESITPRLIVPGIFLRIREAAGYDGRKGSHGVYGRVTSYSAETMLIGIDCALPLPIYPSTEVPMWIVEFLGPCFENAVGVDWPRSLASRTSMMHVLALSVPNEQLEGGGTPGDFTHLCVAISGGVESADRAITNLGSVPRSVVVPTCGIPGATHLHLGPGFMPISVPCDVRSGIRINIYLPDGRPVVYSRRDTPSPRSPDATLQVTLTLLVSSDDVSSSFQRR